MSEIFIGKNNSIVSAPAGPTNPLPPKAYHLINREIPRTGWKKSGVVQVVTQTSFPVLENQHITAFTLELFDESMRIIHWHDGTSELGVVTEGELRVRIWRAPNESSVFVVPEGGLWFIPEGAPHCLEAIGNTKPKLLVGFSSTAPGDFDYPVAYNFLPEPLRIAYTAPKKHADLVKYSAPVFDVFTGYDPLSDKGTKVDKNSPWVFDLRDATPLFKDKNLGKITWATERNWPAIREGKISFIQTNLKPGVQRDAIWWPSASVLYLVSKGIAEFKLMFTGWEPVAFIANRWDYIFVPSGVLHTFRNLSDNENLEVVGFFNSSNPLPEISLIASTNFFPKSLGNASLVNWGNNFPSSSKKNKYSQQEPLKYLRNITTTPYLFPINRLDKKGDKSLRRRQQKKKKQDIVLEEPKEEEDVQKNMIKENSLDITIRTNNNITNPIPNANNKKTNSSWKILQLCSPF